MFTLFIATLVLTLGVQMWLRSTYGRWERVANASGLTGADTARAILRANGLHDVKVEPSRVSSPTTTTPAPRPSASPRPTSASQRGRLRRGRPRGRPRPAARQGLRSAADAGGARPRRQHRVLRSSARLDRRSGASCSAPSRPDPGRDRAVRRGAVLFQLVTLPVEFDASRGAPSPRWTASGLATSADVGGRPSRQVLRERRRPRPTSPAAAAASVAYLLYYVMQFARRCSASRLASAIAGSASTATTSRRPRRCGPLRSRGRARAIRDAPLDGATSRWSGGRSRKNATVLGSSHLGIALSPARARCARRPSPPAAGGSRAAAAGRSRAACARRAGW
jgi:uncharacterized protein